VYDVRTFLRVVTPRPVAKPLLTSSESKVAQTGSLFKLTIRFATVEQCNKGTYYTPVSLFVSSVLAEYIFSHMVNGKQHDRHQVH